jgi:glucose/arabinose dehydrogenase
MRSRILLLVGLLAILAAVVYRQREVIPLLWQEDEPAPAGGHFAKAAASLPDVPAELASKLDIVPFVDGLSMPVGMAVPPEEKSGRLFFVEKTGTIRIVRNGKVEPKPFLDLTNEVTKGGEQGLLGLAFHPDYAKNGRLFVDLTDTKGDTHVLEFKVSAQNPDVVDPASRKSVLFIKQPYSNHNAGNILFGPDRLLYVATGDGGAGGDPQGNAQNDASLLGKMLLINVDAPNPKPETVAKGLRNPWRYSFDRATRDLYIADVGQNHWEFVHVVPKGEVRGKNFGWNIVEGSHCFQGERCDKTGLETPEAEYPHPQGCSITGGYVYRGKAIPELQGIYFYSDFCAPMLRSFRWKDGQAVEQYNWSPALEDPASKFAQTAAFGEDNDGELYVISLTGKVGRFVRKQ